MFCGLMGGIATLAYLRFFNKSIIGNDLTNLDTHFITALVAIILGFFYATVRIYNNLHILILCRHSKDYLI